MFKRFVVKRTDAQGLVVYQGNGTGFVDDLYLAHMYSSRIMAEAKIVKDMVWNRRLSTPFDYEVIEVDCEVANVE